MGYEVWDGPEVVTVWENFDALNTDQGHPSRSKLDTFYLDDDTILRTQTSPDQIKAMLTRKPPIYMVSPGRVYRRDTPDATHSPTFQQVECLAVDRGITLADLRGTVQQYFRQLFGPDRDVRMRTSFFPFTEPSVEFDVTCFLCDGQGCAVCKHSGWIEMGGAGWVDPDVFRTVGLDPDEWQGFAFGFGIERIAHAPARPARPARVLGERHPRAGAVLMKVPVSAGCASTSSSTLPVEELARRLVFTSCEVDRIVRRGVPDVDGNLGHFVVGKVLEAGKHPNADKLQLTKVDVGDGEPRSIVCGAWNFGAGATVAVVTPGALMPGGELRIEKRKLRGEVSEGMILSERELELGADHAGIMVLADDLAAGTPLVDVLPLGDDVLEIETLYNRPDLTSIYGIAREVAALTGAELEPVPGTRSRARRRRAVSRRDRRPRGLPALHRAALPRRHASASRPPWLKARLIGARDAPDLERGRHHQLRDARARQPAARVRRRHARGGIVVRRARPEEELVHARRDEARTRSGRSRDRRPRAPDRPRRRDGRREHRGLAIDNVGRARDRELRAADGDQERRAAPHALRGADALGERRRLPRPPALAATYASQLLAELAGARWTG